ncbi:lysylphosphatidylglycerol synthase transmembrane domain-containing protein [Flavobacterium sp. DGU11]|uniref:Lysylphosphatidylglycerol synthase transmembrane domain-containing protein n=1 Tax=Flavobacterium arundinis TaxID=3139143 RepID=A0ABU9HX13_9FLAO
MNKKLSKFLSIILPLLLGVFLIIYMYRQSTPQELADMKNSFKTADYFYVYISLIIGLTGFWARAYRWKYTLAHLGYNVPFGIKFGSVCITYIMNMLIPRSGEVSRAVALNKYAGVPFDKAFGTIIAERIIDLILLVIVVALTAALQFDAVEAYLADIPFRQLFFYGTVAGILFIGSVLFFMYSKMAWVQKIKLKISGLTEGVLSAFKMPNKWPFFLLSLYIWFSYVLMFYVTIYALPETAGLSFGTVITAFVIGSIVITFTNGGTGFFPVAISNILYVYGVPKAAGFAFGCIVWGSQTGQILFLGGLSFLLLPIVYRNK